MCTEGPAKAHVCPSSVAPLPTVNAAPVQSVHPLSSLQEQPVPFSTHTVPVPPKPAPIPQLLHGGLWSHPQVTQVGPHEPQGFQELLSPQGCVAPSQAHPEQPVPLESPAKPTAPTEAAGTENLKLPPTSVLLLLGPTTQCDP